MVLITGATGGLGAAVAHFLKSKNINQKIAVLVRDTNSEKAIALAAAGFEVKKGDYEDVDSLKAAFDGIETLYFVSGSDMGKRLGQHKNVIEAAKTSKLKHIFYTSVSLNNFTSNSPLFEAMSHHTQTEEWIKELGISYTILRHNLYNDILPMVFLGAKEQLLASKTVFLPTENGKTAFISCQDLAEAAANALVNPTEHINKIYELNGKNNIQFAEIAEILSEITAEKINYVSPTASIFEETMKQYGVPEEYIGLMSAFSVAISQGTFEANTSDIELLLGRNPESVKAFLTQAYGA